MLYVLFRDFHPGFAQKYIMFSLGKISFSFSKRTLAKYVTNSMASCKTFDNSKLKFVRFTLKKTCNFEYSRSKMKQIRLEIFIKWQKVIIDPKQCKNSYYRIQMLLK